jgi:hypothetical protein
LAIYTPLYKTLNAVKQYKPSYQLGTSRRSTGSGMTPYEQELLPYVQQAQTGQQRKRNWLQPIEFVFDLLSRGQYMTANTAKQITRNIREGRPVLEGVPREAWEGITGKEKGDWSTVLWGGADKGGEQFSGWGQGWGDELEKSWWGRRLKGGMALGANILLDPTTYIGSPITKGARAAARQASEDAVKLAAKNIALTLSDDLPEMVAKVGGADAVETLIKKGPAAIKEVLGADASRYMNTIAKAVKKYAIRNPAEKVRKLLIEGGEVRKGLNIGGAQPLYEKLASKIHGPQMDLVEKMMASGATEADIAKAIRPTAADEGLRELSKFIKGMETGYSGAGTRAFKYMGIQGKGRESYPLYIKAWDKAAELVQNSKVGGLMSDAWWAIMNNPKSPIKHIKALFNVRNPYEQMVWNRVLDKDAFRSQLVGEKTTEILSGIKDLAKEDYVPFLNSYYRMAADPAADFNKILDEIAVPGLEKRSKYMQAQTKLSAIFERWNGKMRELNTIDPAAVPAHGYIVNYFPEQIGYEKSLFSPRPKPTIASPQRQGFQKARTIAPTTAMGQDVYFWAKALNITPEEAGQLVYTLGATNITNMQLPEILVGRAIAHARAEARFNLLQQIKEFGVDIRAMDEYEPELYAILQKGIGFGQGRARTPFLSKVEDAALDGYLFDETMVDVFDRALVSSSNDKAIKNLMRTIQNTTAWMKGWMTLSPGFHLRNFYSNETTMFLKNGVKAFDPKNNLEAVIAANYALYGEDALKKLAKVGIGENVSRGMLEANGGELMDLAMDARTRGVVSKNIMAVDAPSTIEALTKTDISASPFSRNFAPMKVSKQVGEVVENQPRFLSFLLDYREAVRQGADPRAAMDWAGWEAKKWFIDYTDLSPFEQKVMKNIIPFYTWIRKNLANQITGMMDFREMYAIIPKVTKGAKEPGAVPEYMEEVGYVPLREEKAGIFRMLWPNLPYMDINKIPLKFEMTEAGIPIPRLEAKNVLGDILSNAHPILKTVAEFIPEEKWDVYYRRPIGDISEAPRIASKVSRMIAARPELLQVVDGFLMSIGVKEGIGARLDGKGRLMINSTVARILDNNVPLLQKINQYLDAPEYLVNAIRGAQGRTEKGVTEEEHIKQGFQALAFNFGIKMKYLDESEEMGKQSDEILREAEEALRKERKKRPQYKQAQLRNIRSRLLRKQRLGISG